LHRPAGSSGQWTLTSYVPDKQSLNLSGTWRLPDGRIIDTSGFSHVRGHAARELTSSADLKSFDLLFCDSVGFAIVKYRKSVKYRPISEESLAEIDNIANAMLRPKRQK